MPFLSLFVFLISRGEAKDPFYPYVAAPLLFREQFKSNQIGCLLMW